VPVTAARIHPKPAGGERRAELGLLNHSRPARHDNQQEVNRDAELGLLNHSRPTRHDNQQEVSAMQNWGF
jgi:hypothetical protein